MKNNSKSTLNFNKSTLSELNESDMLKINGGTLETSGYCCFTTKQLELDNA
ncbi:MULTISPECIES: class I lanthipeptide [unclassified Flavobacterium]|uniref:class I lanthipeptide n=1 Tax=unclassified Flavobacterium TaxID=196869 RepID=UPI003611FCE0